MLHFTIRDLLLLTVIVALALGWWLDRGRQQAVASALLESQQEAEEKLSRLLEVLKGKGEHVTFSEITVTIRTDSRATLHFVPSRKGSRDTFCCRSAI